VFPGFVPALTWHVTNRTLSRIAFLFLEFDFFWHEGGGSAFPVTRQWHSLVPRHLGSLDRVASDGAHAERQFVKLRLKAIEL